MTAYYNEIDPRAAQWIRNLIAAGHIAPGEVDERSIEDVRPSDLDGFVQCHFFAGIAVWSHALRKAGWPDSRPVWTGSCPCQPFSAAGKGAGFADERHLWPAFNHLIEQCRPPIVLGEQVASKDGLDWLDLVLADLEAQGYAAGAVDTCAAGFGAPHIRQRLYWVGNANSARLERHARNDRSTGWQRQERPASETGLSSGLANSKQSLLGSQAESANHRQSQADRSADWDGGCGCASGGVADTESGRRGEKQSDAGWCIEGAGEREAILPAGNGGTHRPGPTNGFWRDADWLGCRDGKWRPVRPGSFPLAYGAPARVGRLRAYGNGLCAIQAQGFIESVMDYMGPSV